MWFWVKHLSLAIILIAAALYFLFGKGPVIDIKNTQNANKDNIFDNQEKEEKINIIIIIF